MSPADIRAYRDASETSRLLAEKRLLVLECEAAPAPAPSRLRRLWAWITAPLVP